MTHITAKNANKIASSKLPLAQLDEIQKEISSCANKGLYRAVFNFGLFPRCIEDLENMGYQVKMDIDHVKANESMRYIVFW